MRGGESGKATTSISSCFADFQVHQFDAGVVNISIVSPTLPGFIILSSLIWGVCMDWICNILVTRKMFARKLIKTMTYKRNIAAEILVLGDVIAGEGFVDGGFSFLFARN